MGVRLEVGHRQMAPTVPTLTLRASHPTALGIPLANATLESDSQSDTDLQASPPTGLSD